MSVPHNPECVTYKASALRTGNERTLISNSSFPVVKISFPSMTLPSFVPLYTVASTVVSITVGLRGRPKWIHIHVLDGGGLREVRPNRAELLPHLEFPQKLAKV